MLTTRRRNNVSLKKGIVLYTIPGKDKEYKGMILVCHPYEVIITSRESQLPTLLIRDKTLSNEWSILFIDGEAHMLDYEDGLNIKKIMYNDTKVKELIENDDGPYIIKQIKRVRDVIDI
jgi:hypothetical protein